MMEVRLSVIYRGSREETHRISQVQIVALAQRRLLTLPDQASFLRRGILGFLKRWTQFPATGSHAGLLHKFSNLFLQLLDLILRSVNFHNNVIISKQRTPIRDYSFS